MRQLGSTATWYAALLIELGRLASGMVSVLRGESYALATNTASVITPDGNYTQRI